MSALSSALDYATLGLPVIPLKDRSKEPRIKAWPDRASIDPVVIKKWFSTETVANLGLVMGEGVAALDFDAARGGLETYRRLIEDGELPETATARTGGGGRHRIYRVGEPVGNRHDLQPGMDVKGCRGFIVADPSIHPTTGEPYVFERHPNQGIAQAPGWLLETLAATDRDARPSGGADSSPVILGAPRQGDLALLSGEMIRRFPVLAIGRRNDQMVRCIGSLLARGFEDQTIEESVGLWWEHFHGLGLVSTSPVQAPRLIRQSIASMRRSPRFIVGGSIDHRAACRGIEINAQQRTLIRSDVEELRELQSQLPLVEEGGPEGDRRGDPTPNRIAVPRTSRRLCDRLCQSIEETAFVESVLVLAQYSLKLEPDQSIRFTHDQIRLTASDRYPGVEWSNGHMERIKSKYIARPGKPATVFELVRETGKGQRGKGGKPGTPSEYRATGLRVFLAL